MLEDREILVSANLESAAESGGPRKYSYYAAMLVKASHALTRKTLTDYQVYSKLISYIDKAEWNEAQRTLRIEGGIWKFRLESKVRFTEKSDRHVEYRIVEGHFAGLAGDILFEPLGEKGTAVHFRGQKLGKNWPPAFVIERGAEIVFGFTARKMRSYVESLKAPSHEEEGPTNPVTVPIPVPVPVPGQTKDPTDGDRQIPKPRTRI